MCFLIITRTACGMCKAYEYSSSHAKALYNTNKALGPMPRLSNHAKTLYMPNIVCYIVLSQLYFLEGCTRNFERVMVMYMYLSHTQFYMVILHNGYVFKVCVAP